MGAGSVRVSDTAPDVEPTALDTICAATGEVALHTSREPSGDHVGRAISPWLAFAMGVIAVPFGRVTTSRPCASMIAKRPTIAGNAAAGLSAGRVVDAVLVGALGRVVVVVVGRVLLVVAPAANVVVVVVLVTEGVVVRRVVVVARADWGLRS